MIEINLNGEALHRYDVDNIALSLFETGVKNLHISCDMWGLAKLKDFYEGWLNIPVRDDENDMIVVRGVHPSGQGMFIIVKSDAKSGEMEFWYGHEHLASISNYSVSL